jgi:hypothetical protein
MIPLFRRLWSQYLGLNLKSFCHVDYLDNFYQIIELYGKDASTAESTIETAKKCSWNYQRLFIEQMLKITRFYYYQTKRDELLLAASGVFEKW